MIFVFGVFAIPIPCETANELTFFSFHIQVTANAQRNIPAVSVIDKIVERNQNTALIIVFLCTVIMIVDGDKAHTHEWKDSFQITTRFNVVSAETR